ncbi:mediator complex subunit 13 C-terminal-domain-containing protein [Morchella snyderi]|nr:mediator complex subunit 13 C-terminal-domain-containing protein [Morchella snyderi]
MESPETCLTNVLKIENLSRIPYTLYRPSDDNPPQPPHLSQPPQPPQPPQQLPHSPQQLPQSQSQSRLLPASLNRHTTNALRHAERTLRTEGNIVYADRDSVTLWLFQIEGFPSPPGNTAIRGAGNGKDACGDDSMEGEVQAQIAEEETSGKWKRIDARLRDEWGLRESSSGAFLASALAPPQPPHTATFHSSSSRPATPGFPPTPMSGMFPPSSHSTPAAIDLTDDGASEDASPPEDQFAAYKRFITAVLLSLHFEMAAGSGYTPLNIRTLVSPASLRLSISEERGGEKEDTGKADQQLLPSTPVVVPEVIRPTVVALDAYLTTSGTLLIIPHTEVQPAIRRVSSCATRGMCGEEGLGGRDVYIAPWGEWGRLLPSTPATEPAISAKELKWKSAVRSYLQDCGILSTPGNGWRGDAVNVLGETIQTGDWRRIEIWIPFKEFPGMGMTVKVLWPEALLFMKASENDTIPSVDVAQTEDAAEGEDVFWKTVFADPEYAHFASGSLSMSLASLVFADDGQQLARARKDIGADWWAMASAVEWAEEWLAGREERDRVVKARLEEKKALRLKREEDERQAAEKEERVRVKEEDKAQETHAQMEMEMEMGMPEAMDAKEDKAKLKMLEQKNPAGVYPTPPEGGQQTAQSMGGTGGPGSTSSGSAPNTAAISAEAIISAVPTETDMELDWTAELPGVAEQVGEPGRKQSDAAAIGGLAGGTGEADLFGGDMDDDDMFGHAITEDDFAFFDNNPGGLEDFGDDLGGMGEDDVNMALEDMDLGGGAGSSNIGAQQPGGGGGEMDLTMEIPMHAREEMVIESSPAVAMAQPPTINIDVSRADGHHDPKLLSGGSASEKLAAEREPHIQTPPLSPHRAIRLLVPEYSLSPNNQPHPTPPTTGGAMKTPQNNGAPPPPPPPSGGVSEAKRRMSLYSPITFTTKIEMADRKYAPGGRYFLPESIKDKELKEFESKQGKLEMPKVPSTPSGQKRKRGIFVRSVVVEENAEAAAPEVAEVVLADDAVMSGESPEDDECDAGEYSDDDEWSEESSVESDADDETEEEDEADAGARYYTSPLTVAYGGSAGGSKKRKWGAFEDDGESSTADTMKREPGAGAGVSVGVGVGTGADGEAEAPGELAPPPWEVMVPDPTDASLVGVFSTMTLETDAVSLAGMGDADFLTVSRLVREQVVSGTARPLGALLDGGSGGGSAWETAAEDDNEEWCLLRRRRGKDEEAVEEAARGLFGSATVVRCTLETYVAVADAVVIEPPPLLVGGRAAAMRPIAQPRRGNNSNSNSNSNSSNSGSGNSSNSNTPGLSKRPSSASDPAAPTTNSAIFRLPPPHVHIHRAEQALEILPPALHFWETFGFGPCSGPKNVIGFCLHPASRAMDDAADGLLDRVSFSYEAGRFGTHVRGRLDASAIAAGSLGIAPRDGAAVDSLEKGVAVLMDGMADFGAVLAGGVADELQNIVVYVINPFEHPSAVVDICAGFVRMCRAYAAGCGPVGAARRNNLVLQIVPAAFVARRCGGVGRGQGEWATLASEVYNRCMPTDGVGSLEEAQKTFSPSIYLARSPPKTIEFRATDPSPALLHENSILHIAYAQSLDERWVSVAWTDAWGEQQATESYCLSRKNCTVLRPFDDVCRDIWQKTLEITRIRRVAWRLMLTKVAATMPPDEIDIWARLSRSSIGSLTHTLTLLTADVAPPLAVTPVLPPIAPAQFNPLMATGTGTPPGVTTPTPGGGGSGTGSIVSPDQFGGAAGTPSADLLPEVDPGSALVDYGDEVWGVVCAHRWRRGLLLGLDDAGGGGGMGYLVKRGGAGEGDDMVVLGVEVVRGAGSGVLREVLAAWRELVTLGQFKGVVEMAGRGSVVPWHVAAAWKGVEALGFVM